MAEANSALIEAESFTLESGFSVVESGIASGGAWVQHTSGPTASMSITLLGQDGTYDLVVTYFDEADGASEAIVKVNDEIIDRWLWNQDLGSANANRATLTTHVVKGVKLGDAATLAIEGRKDGKEPLRIDKVEFIPSISTTALSDTAQLLAFPGAQGFGAVTAGGRGGQIVKVTNLEPSGVGSLRWALEDLTGPRIVVFDVGGVVALKYQIEVNGQVTVAGQTAPGGFTIIGARLRVVESDVIIRGLNIRPGDGEGDQPDNRDGVSVGVRGAAVDGVIIDSNSISWTVDEGLTTWGAPNNVTFSNNLIAEALRHSVHPEGRHSMGMLIGDGSSNVTAVGNLFAHNQFRNATVKDGSKGVEFINNVIYNYGPHGFLAQSASTAHVIGNVYIAGPDSARRAPIRLTNPETGAAYYLRDNVGAIGGPAVSEISTSYVFEPSNVTIRPTSEVLDHVLANVAARVPELGPIDARIIQSVLDRSGAIIDSPRDVGGYEFLPVGTPLPDQDGDGIPDSYEPIIGSDPAEFDAHGDANGDGYSNIESYINGLFDGFDPSAPFRGNSGAGASVGNGPTSTPGDSTESSTPKPDPISFEPKGIVPSPKSRNDFNGNGFGDKPINGTDGGVHSQTFIFDSLSRENKLVIAQFDEIDGTTCVSDAIGDELKITFLWPQRTTTQFVKGKAVPSCVLEDVLANEVECVTLTECISGHELLRIDAVELVADVVFG